MPLNLRKQNKSESEEERDKAYIEITFIIGGGAKIAAVKGLRLCPLVFTVKVAGGKVERSEARTGK